MPSPVARKLFPAVFAVLFSLTWISTLPARAMELIMFEQEACEWCEAWDEEIGGVYHKTTEGKIAPLRKVDIFDKRPEDLKELRDAHFTPTFVLMDGGKEIGRIRGYPGEDFFWGMLGELIEKAKKKKAVKARKESQNPA
jgi:thioredoxin-related protein